jgi:GT2 family glycosyltransferase
VPPLAVILITHTPRHLRRSLLAVAASDRRPDAVVVSTDGDHDDLRACVLEASREFALPLTLVRRPHTGQSRSPQVRNNAVRTLLSMGWGEEHDARLVFFDGDCAPARACLAEHERLGAVGRVVVGFRVDLSEAQTLAFDEAAVARGEPPAAIEPAQWAELASRDRRYRRALLWRRLGIGKAHKPKILSANVSVPLAAYLAINGFDEEYVGWGAEDDDLGRRLYANGTPAVVGVAAAVVFHQWHPTRAPGEWAKNAGAPRFLRGTPTRAVRGVENPLDQPPMIVEHFKGGGA